jgi:uncharacterized membrane protein (DUF4010 family)
MKELEAAYPFLVSLGVGLLLGLERERRPQAKAGLRTFTLVAVLGTACAMLGQIAASAWLLPAGLLACTLIMVAAERQSGGEADVTTTIALVLCFAYGAMLWEGYLRLTVALALATTALLYFKAELHAVSHKLSRSDMVSFLQFAVITFIVLPLLPDQGYGPYEAINPYRVWLMIVLITGIGLAGYVALRLLGTNHGAPLLGFLGGLVSSTATTFVFARQRGDAKGRVSAAQIIILVANLVLLVRIAFVTVVIAPGGLKSLAPALLLGLLAGLVVPWRIWRSQTTRPQSSELPAKNPVELLPALTFGAIYAGALILTAWLDDLFGTAGIYALAAVLGLTDMDAITLSALKLHGSKSLDGTQLTTAIVIALAANLAFKAGIARVLGGAELARPVMIGFASVLVGLAAGLGILRAFH